MGQIGETQKNINKIKKGESISGNLECPSIEASFLGSVRRTRVIRPCLSHPASASCTIGIVTICYVIFLLTIPVIFVNSHNAI